MPLKILHGGEFIDYLLYRLRAVRAVRVDSLDGQIPDFSPFAVHQVSG